VLRALVLVSHCAIAYNRSLQTKQTRHIDDSKCVTVVVDVADACCVGYTVVSYTRRQPHSTTIRVVLCFVTHVCAQFVFTSVTYKDNCPVPIIEHRCQQCPSCSCQTCSHVCTCVCSPAVRSYSLQQHWRVRDVASLCAIVQTCSTPCDESTAACLSMSTRNEQRAYSRECSVITRSNACVVE
jgi:hypothetical protein